MPHNFLAVAMDIRELAERESNATAVRLRNISSVLDDELAKTRSARRLSRSDILGSILERGHELIRETLARSVTGAVETAEDVRQRVEECFRITTTNPLLFRKWVEGKITNRLTGAFRIERKYVS